MIEAKIASPPAGSSRAPLVSLQALLQALYVAMPSVFKPCIDLHHGAVKQIVGGSLDTENLRTNFVSE